MAAVLLNEPKNAYLELAAQPANNTPYTPKEDKAKVYKIPKLKSDKANPCPKGIIPHKKNLFSWYILILSNQINFPYSLLNIRIIILNLPYHIMNYQIKILIIKQKHYFIKDPVYKPLNK